jgi:heme oxygenase
MSTEPSGHAPALMEELKAKNAPVHKRLENSPFFSALTTGHLPLESYVGQLRTLALIHGTLEPALLSCMDERIAAVWSSEMSKLSLLYKDLRYFEPRIVADLKEATEASLEIAESLRRLSIEQPLALLGSVYVLEGSTLGGTILGPMVARVHFIFQVVMEWPTCRVIAGACMTIGNCFNSA